MTTQSTKTKIGYHHVIAHEKEILKEKAAIGLALSGGGIRSSAFCLGVLQALNYHGKIKKIGYLSTVSGGGYIGSALTSTMTLSRGRFEFGGEPRQRSGEPIASDIKDTYAVQHIRNYSNYLIPSGFRDVVTALAIIIRGLVANAALVLPFILGLAVITLSVNSCRTSLDKPKIFGKDLNLGRLIDKTINITPEKFLSFSTVGFTMTGVLLGLITAILCRKLTPSDRPLREDIQVRLWKFVVFLGLLGFTCDIAARLNVKHFSITLAACLLGLLLFFLWALARSFVSSRALQEYRGNIPALAAGYLLFLAAIAFFELQPFAIAGMFDTAQADQKDAKNILVTMLTPSIQVAAAAAASVAAVVMSFRQQLGAILKGADGSSGVGALLKTIVTKGLIWTAGAALPLLIWVGFLHLCFWATVDDKHLGSPPPGFCGAYEARAASTNPGPQPTERKSGIGGGVQLSVDASASTGNIAGKVGHIKSNPAHVSAASVRERYHQTHAPEWLFKAAQWTTFYQGQYRAIVIFYFIAAVVIFLASWGLSPNSNSLHRLYRDRLSKAFLFKPKSDVTNENNDDNKVNAAQGNDIEPEPNDDFQVRALSAENTPYHIIGAALNIQGSDYANRRGRNADFFMFSPKYVGSEATGYAATEKFSDLDLATAFAISGAAASSNMGSKSIRPLMPTLALLNVRLGYWLNNPRYVDGATSPTRRSPLYLWKEMTGSLHEEDKEIYLTDGGHIENLGVYELLRRKCKLIVAVDAEADPAMHFSSFVTLQRYARIDEGIRINLQWQSIQSATRACMAENATKAAPCQAKHHGPHVAIGTIEYDAENKGTLIYIKSSLTGDENDYVRDYARRNPLFPHETTGDQFFSEEQFEAYRALGFHITHRFLNKEDTVDTGLDPSNFSEELKAFLATE